MLAMRKVVFSHYISSDKMRNSRPTFSEFTNKNRSVFKFGLLLLACLICTLVILFADLFGESSRNSKEQHQCQYYNFRSDTNLKEQNIINVETKENLGADTRQRKSFHEIFVYFPWDDFKEALKKGNDTASNSYNKVLIDELTYFLALEPSVQVNVQCTPPPLPSPSQIDCRLYPDAFNGDKRSIPVKVGVLIQFGFDVDILEIHLNELYDVVDKFFLIESTHAHYGNLVKPLMWELVKRQDRFKKFPVVHFIIDDAESAKATVKNLRMESMQEMTRWLKFLEWNEAEKYFSDDDIIGFGDADEIPNRAKLNLFKYCDIKEESVDFGIWFPFGHINQTYRSDFPVPSHPLSLGDPTFFKLSSAKRFAAEKPNEYPSRRRGQSGNYMLGGIHMTHYGYLPFQMIKHATASEEGMKILEDVERISKYLKQGDIERSEVDLAATPKEYMRRIAPVNMSDPDMKEICILPWFYDCNRKRYPVWDDGHDTRLD